MKRKLVILTLITTMGLSVFSGCGKQTQTADKKEKSEIASEIEAFNSEDDERIATEDDIYNSLLDYKPAKEWKDVDYKAKGFQIADVFIYEGEKLSDVVSAFEKSDLDWEYSYNPDGTVDNQTTLHINYKGKPIVDLNVIAETDNKKCSSKDGVLYYVTPNWKSQDVTFIYGVQRNDIKNYTFEEMSNLKDTLFKGVDDVEVEAGTSNCAYTVQYEVQTPNRVVEYRKVYNFSINQNNHCEFTVMTTTEEK